MGHGITRVDRQVDDHLLDMTGIYLDLPQVGRGPGDQLDIFADQPAQHFVEIQDQRVEIEHTRLDDLLSGEGQQLACRPAARQAAFSATSKSCWAGLCWGISARAMPIKPITADSMLLKSWAIPPASCPMLSIF